MFIVYRIANSENISYIGTTTISLQWRFFDAPFAHFKQVNKDIWHKLYNAMRLEGIHTFSISVIKLCKDIQEMYEIESQSIAKYDSFRNGYNHTIDGRPFANMIGATAGRKYLNNSTENIIPPISELQTFIDNGWEFGRLCKPTLNTKYMHKDGQYKMVDMSLVNAYINKGWEFNSPAKHTIHISKNGIDKMISAIELDNFIMQGWVVGMSKPATANKKWLHKNGHRKYVDVNKINEYLQNGWQLGQGKLHKYDSKKQGAGCRYVTKNRINKRIAKADIQKYLDCGWKLGMSKRSTTY